MTIIKRRCESCGRFIARKPASPFGPARKFCNDTCQQNRKNVRERDRYRQSVYFAASKKAKARPFKATLPLGTTTNGLTLLAYAEPVRSSREGIFLCQCGNTKRLYVKNVKAGLSKTCADRSRHPDPRLTNTPAYRTVHARWENVYGKARTLPCLACGEVTEHNQVSYLHSAADERADAAGKEAGKPYSVNLEDYAVLCKNHHSRFDNGYRRAFAKGTPSLAHIALGAVVSQCLKASA